MRDDRLPPQDLEAERCVIGGCLLHQPAIDEAQSILASGHFYATHHQLVFGAILALHNQNRPVDSVMVAKELERRKQLEVVGGAKVLMACMEAVPHSVHTGHYARIVREKWIRRQVIENWNEAVEAAHDQSLDIEGVLTAHDNATQNLLETGVSTSDLFSMEEILLAAMSQDPDRRMGLMTGMLGVDQMTSGMKGGNLIAIAARASMGKTAFALSVVRSLIERKHPTLFVSLEMGMLEVAERLVSMQSRVPAFAIRKNLLEKEHHEWLVEAGNAMREWPLVIDHRGEQTVSMIGATARLMKRRRGIECVVIDYLQLIEPDKDDRKSVREQQVAGITRRLKTLARSLDIPILVLAQLNRDVEKRDNKRPRLSDIRESGAIEQDCDQVWLLYRPDYYEADESKHDGAAELIVAKNRNGPVGSVNLQWEKQTMHFREADDATIQHVKDF